MNAKRPSPAVAAARDPAVPPPDRVAARFAQRRSPLDDVQAVAGLDAPQPSGMVIVHGSAPDASAGASAVLSLGPSRWLAVHDTGPDRRSLVDLHGGPAVAEDIGGGLIRLRVTGADARVRVASGVAIDLHPDVFPADASATTAYREVFVVLHASGDATLDLYVLRSFARTLWRWLSDGSSVPP